MKNKRNQCSRPYNRTRIQLRCDYREDDFELWPRPSELQLAQMAAQLARSSQINPKQLVEIAWEIYWESCRVIKQDYQVVKNFLDCFWNEWDDDETYDDDSREQIPVPKSFPIPFKTVELLLLPKLKGRTADRARIFRDFLFEDYVRCQQAPRTEGQDESQEPPTPEYLERLRENSKAELDSLFGQLRLTIFDAGYYTLFAQKFLDWYRKRSGLIKSMVRAASARRSWEQRRKQNRTKLGAKPNHEALKSILEAPLPLDGSKGKKNRGLHGTDRGLQCG